MAHPLGWIPHELNSLAENGLLRRRMVIQPMGLGRILVDGCEAWDFASNDYLGLANDPRVIAAAIDVIRRYGTGAKASPLVSGRTDVHAELEQALAEFEGTESAILFPTGMAANMGTVAALAEAGDSVFCDRLNHASLVDGCRLSGARLRVYRHDDLDGLRKSIARETARRKFIVTDSVFSMDGDLAPLAELCDIAEKNETAMIVDEAHGSGVFGSNGRGVAELTGTEERIAVRIGTLSKAIGSLGGFVSGSRTLVDYLWNRARTQIYSTALPPAQCAAAIASLKIIRDEPSRRQRLHELATVFRRRICEVGLRSIANSTGPIIPIILQSPESAIRVADQLLAKGFLVGAIRPPTVPRGTSRLRVTMHSEIPVSAIAELATTISEFVSSGHEV